MENSYHKLDFHKIISVKIKRLKQLTMQLSQESGSLIQLQTMVLNCKLVKVLEKQSMKALLLEKISLLGLNFGIPIIARIMSRKLFLEHFKISV